MIQNRGSMSNLGNKENYKDDNNNQVLYLLAARCLVFVTFNTQGNSNVMQLNNWENKVSFRVIN